MKRVILLLFGNSSPHGPARSDSLQYKAQMKITTLFLLTFSFALRAADAPPPAAPALPDKVRLEFAEARAARTAAQGAYDALPAQIKKAFEDSLQALQGAIQAENNAAAAATTACGSDFQPFLDAKGILSCQPKPILSTPPAK